MIRSFILCVSTIVLSGCTVFGEPDLYQDFTLYQIEKTNICFFNETLYDKTNIKIISKKTECNVFQDTKKIKNKPDDNDILIDGYILLTEDKYYQLKTEDIFDEDDEDDEDINQHFDGSENEVSYEIETDGTFYSKKSKSCYIKTTSQINIPCEI